jgi:hypothetical protein
VSRRVWTGAVSAQCLDSPDLLEASLLLLAAILAVGGVCDYNEGKAQRDRQGNAVGRAEGIPKGSINVQWRRYPGGSQLECLCRHGQNIFSDARPPIGR